LRAALPRAGSGSWRWLLAITGAVCVNLVIFGSMSFLSRELEHVGDTLFRPVRIFMPTHTPQPKEEPPPPEKPPPKTEITQMKMQQLKTPPVELEKPQLDFEVNPRLGLGLALPPPGPARYELGQVDRAPMIASQLPPPYPYTARRRGIEGAVKIRFLVDEQGHVQHLEILEARPSGVFEESVLRTVPRWRFRPGRKDGQPVATWVETTIKFELKN
jgi:periplasmic protein TonB